VERAIFDRHLVLIITQGYMFAIAVSLGLLTIMGITNPSILLTLTFALGIGSSISMPATIPIPSSLVPRSEMPATLTLGAIGINIGRAIGPTAGGFIVTATAPWIVFF
jgi:MFS family permease